jgi:hypothetical protein
MTTKPALQVLAFTDSNSMLDTWTEYLCLEHHADGSITLSLRGYAVLGSAADYGYDPEAKAEAEDEGAEYQEPAAYPEFIDGVRVSGRDGEYLIGDELVNVADDSEIDLRAGEINKAIDWLEDNGWHEHQEYREAILKPIEAALLGSIQPVVAKPERS